MKTYLVTRHSGAQEWANKNDIRYDCHLKHLDISKISFGDVVVGTLPINLAADVQARGARYLHISLNLPFGLRGKELSFEEMVRYDAKLQEYKISPIGVE